MPNRPMLALVSFAIPAALGATASNPPQTETYRVQMTGMAETDVHHTEGGVGDPDATGSAKIVIDSARERICYDFKVTGLATPLMAHIHRAPPLRNGPTVVTLFTEIDGDLKGCKVWTPKQLAAIAAQPSHYYVNFYTTEFPDGAVRGQLH